MDEGEDFQIVNMRTWQLTESTAGNYFMEPDFHYTVLNTSFEPDNSVVEVDEAGIMRQRRLRALQSSRSAMMPLLMRHTAVMYGAASGLKMSVHLL